MVDYRRRTAGGVWHWCHDCPSYPDEDYLVRDERPERERDLCPRCLALEDSGECGPRRKSGP
jgi:hypothetical protein